MELSILLLLEVLALMGMIAEGWVIWQGLKMIVKFPIFFHV